MIPRRIGHLHLILEVDSFAATTANGRAGWFESRVGKFGKTSLHIGNSVLSILLLFTVVLGPFQYTFAQENSQQHYYNQAQSALDAGQNELAKAHAQQAVFAAKEVLGDESIPYYESIVLMAKVCSEIKELAQADSLYTLAAAMLQHGLTISANVKSAMLVDQAEVLAALERYPEAIEVYHDAIEIMTAQDEVSIAELVIGLNSLALVYQKTGAHSLALEHAYEALDLSRSALPIQNDLYAEVQYTLGASYLAIGKMEQGIDSLKEALNALEANGTEDHGLFIRIASKLAEAHSKRGTPEIAIPLYQKAIQRSKDFPTENDKNLVGLSVALGIVYFRNDLYDESIAAYASALAYIDAGMIPKNNVTYGIIASNLSQAYQKEGMYGKALDYIAVALQCAKEADGIRSTGYASKLNTLARLYLDLGMYEKGAPLSKEALDIVEEAEGKKRLYAILLGTYGALERRRGNFESALLIQYEALEIIENEFGQDHVNYARGLNNLATVYNETDSLDRAIGFLEKSLDITKHKSDKLSPEVLEYYNTLANLYFKSEDFKKALELYALVVAETKEIMGEHHPLYAPRLLSLAQTQRKLNNHDLALEYYSKTMGETGYQIEKTFSFLAEREREAFIEKISGRFSELLDFFFEVQDAYPEVNRMAYDIELATKGMLLSSVRDVRQKVMESGDPQLIQKYETWKVMKSTLQRQHSLPLAQQKANLSQLEDEVELFEREISHMSGQSSTGGSLSVKWDDVKAKLESHEVAIEFSYRRADKEQSGNYSALVLHANSAQPLCIPLFEESILDSLLAGDKEMDGHLISILYRGSKNVTNTSANSIRDTALYNLIWRPLSPHIEKGCTIYYAPTGLLHKIAFNAVKDGEGEYLSQRYALRQVSSTANIGQDVRMKIKNNTSVLLMGGMEFGSHASQTYRWDSLPGTFKEVEAIERMAKRKKVDVEVYTGSDANEAIFKQQVSGKTIVHMATHGFYFPKTNIDQPYEDKDAFATAQEIVARSGRDISTMHLFANSDPLYRSGVVMAGANYYGIDELSKAGEDNILSAAEISNMELQGTMLVVLSACETGLGDVKGTEGVYGLQRGVKMAGVQSLIYTLWKIPDDESAEFMGYFYDGIFSQLDISVAFRQALFKMQAKYDPYYWGAFVLVD